MIKVFIVDDSLAVRSGFKKILSGLDDIKILGEANNPVDAFSVFKRVGMPDVFILDIEMPKMDGLTFFRKLNEERPTPVIICSTLVTKGSDALVDALSLGAISVIAKPKLQVKDFLNEYKDDVIEQIRAAANAKVKFNISLKERTKKITKPKKSGIPSTHVVAIGSSTGGVQVIEEVLTHLTNPNHPAIVIVQHMPVGFTASFAKRLDGLCENSEVVEAKEGDVLTNGKVFISPGGIHMEVKKDRFNYKIALRDFPKVNSHKPSANVLLTSVAKEAKVASTGFIFTGMGDDGAKGLLLMREVGAKTYAQNEKTAVVYGMPKVAVEIGGTDKTLSIFEIIKTINNIK